MRHLRPLLALALLVLAGRAGAQSVTHGGLAGRTLASDGRPIGGAVLTLTAPDAAPLIVRSDPIGRFAVTGLAPATYAVLAEQVGFQPVRVIDVVVVAGQSSPVEVVLTPMPPPVTVVERRWDRLAAASGTVAIGRAWLEGFDLRRDASDLSRGLAVVDGPRDGRPGFAVSAGGMNAAGTRLMVDGVEETLLRHPGLPDEAADHPIFARDALASARVVSFALDPELRSAPGALLELQTRGGGRRGVAGWVQGSGVTLGGRAADNPFDSSATSLQIGGSAAGSSQGGDGGWMVRAEYQRLATPGGDPLVRADGTGADRRVAILEALEASGLSLGADPLGAPVRRWEGITALGRGEWRVGRQARFGLRAGMASWDETNVHPGRQWSEGVGTALAASDVSVAAWLRLGGTAWLSETRLGVRRSSRDWTSARSADALLLDAGVGFGGLGSMPGMFEEQSLELSQTVGYQTGAHTLKAGLQLSRRALTYDWLPLAGGELLFGTIDGLTDARGAITRATASDAADELALVGIGVLLQDRWQLGQAIALTVGLRYATEQLPDLLATSSVAWGRTSGINNTLVPTDKGGAIGPRGALTWDLGGRGQTIVQVGGGLVPGRYDALTLAEVARFDGAVRVERRIGDVLAQPVAADARTALTLFGPDVRQPRTTAAEASLTHRLAAGTTLFAAAGYRHTDYLLRRDDLNRPGASIATLADGRPVWGALTSVDGLVLAAPGSNRRFEEFDRVHLLASTGYVDYTEVRVGVTREVGRGLSLDAMYQWSRTEDNLVNQRAANPDDRLSPLPHALVREWDIGPSDFDVPHRVAVSARWSSSDRLHVAARWRWRSGLPYTPTYLPGVDVNGDGSAYDPVAVRDADGLASLLSSHGCADPVGGFAVRNSCREPSVSAVDIQLAYRLPIGGPAMRITLDGFNLIASTVGIIDRSALRLDPSGLIARDSDGRVRLPVEVNPRFGSFLARRGEPRLIRLGLRLET